MCMSSLYLVGFCQAGYGGTPLRYCLDINEDVGSFGPISQSCLQCTFYLFIYFIILILVTILEIKKKKFLIKFHP